MLNLVTEERRTCSKCILREKFFVITEYYFPTFLRYGSQKKKLVNKNPGYRNESVNMIQTCPKNSRQQAVQTNAQVDTIRNKKREKTYMSEGNL